MTLSLLYQQTINEFGNLQAGSVFKVEFDLENYYSFQKDIRNNYINLIGLNTVQKGYYKTVHTLHIVYNGVRFDVTMNRTYKKTSIVKSKATFDPKAECEIDKEISIDKKEVPGLVVKKSGFTSATNKRISTLLADVYDEAGQPLGSVELDQLVTILNHHGFTVDDNKQNPYHGTY